MSGDTFNWSEILLPLETQLAISREDLDDYDDNYVRRFTGPIQLVLEDDGELLDIGRIELWHIDGSRAAENNLDIVDICDSIGADEEVYASAVYTAGSIDTTVVENPFSNDVLVVHHLELADEYRRRALEAPILGKIKDVLAYHCAAVLVDSELAMLVADDLDLAPTTDQRIRVLF